MKWTPVRVKKTRQIKNLEPRFDSIEAEKALAMSAARVRRQPHTEIASCYLAKVSRFGATPPGVDWTCHATLEMRWCRLPPDHYTEINGHGRFPAMWRPATAHCLAFLISRPYN